MDLITYFTPKECSNEIAFSIEKTESGYFLRSLPSSIEDEHPDFCFKLEDEHGFFSLESFDVFKESKSLIEERLLVLSQNLLAQKESGLDESQEDIEESMQLRYDPEQIIIANKSYSIKNIYDLVKSGDIEIAPNFQRNFVWDRTRQSRLIESIFLGLPLPSIYLNEYNDGRLTIVDGLQRITTIKKFYEDKLKLFNLEYLTDCNGKTYSELRTILSPLLLRRFGQTQIMCFIIDYRSPQELKYDLFRRLNTGGKPLNNQEIRNCLSREPLQVLLKEMIENETFAKVTCGSLKNTRMEAFELALRFIYFYEEYSEQKPTGQYNGHMEDAMNMEVDVLNNKLKNITDGDKYKHIFINSLEMAYKLFGDYSFRKVFTNYKEPNVRRNGINKSLLLTVTVLLAHHRQQYLEKTNKGIDLTMQLAELIETDAEFLNDISWTTNAKPKIQRVFIKLKKMFDKELL